MKRSAVFAALYAAFLVFSLLSLFFGETGVVALKRLEDRNGHLEANMADLEKRGSDLSARLASLRSDPEAIVIEARSLGLYRADDSVVVFEDLGSRRGIPDAGRVLRMVPAPTVNENVLRILALSAGAAAFFLAMIVGRRTDAPAPRRR